jgi:hypothetical protein
VSFLETLERTLDEHIPKVGLVDSFIWDEFLNSLDCDFVRIWRHCFKYFKILLESERLQCFFEPDWMCWVEFEEVLKILQIVPLVEFGVLKSQAPIFNWKKALWQNAGALCLHEVVQPSGYVRKIACNWVNNLVFHLEPIKGKCYISEMHWL